MVDPVLEYPISGYHYLKRLLPRRGQKMKSLAGHANNIVDVRAKLTIGAKLRLWAVVLVLSLLAAGLIWLGYVKLWKPQQYKQTAELVIRDLLKKEWWVKDSIAGSNQVPLADLQPIDQSLELADLLATKKEIGINNENRIELAHKLFQYAIFFGNPFARIDYGIALLEGNLGLPDEIAANYQFTQAAAELKEPAVKGKAREALAYSLLLSAGYGVPKDNNAANSLLGQVLNELSVDELLRLKNAPGNRQNLNPIILTRLIEKGYLVTDSDIKWACITKYIDLASTASQEMVDHNRDSLEIQRLYFSRYTDIIQEETKCINDFKAKRKNGDSGWESIIPAKPNDATSTIREPRGSNRSNKITLPAANERKPVIQYDKEKQSVTGYLNGSPPPQAAGLSTFTIDNKSCSADAIARIYLNCDKPAVRQIYIKTGEKFSATELAPGRYVLRYRFVGNSTTYEADKVFELEEISDSQGVNYSNVSVTLFTVANGNMKVKRVPESNF